MELHEFGGKIVIAAPALFQYCLSVLLQGLIYALTGERPEICFKVGVAHQILHAGPCSQRALVSLAPGGHLLHRPQQFPKFLIRADLTDEPSRVGKDLGSCLILSG
jgi:hypothetical protein